MKKIFGMPIALFVVGLLVIGGASAALVGYLSNQVEAEITVESPIEQWISDGGAYSAGPISFTGFGGETITFYVKTKNKANAAITGNGKNVVTVPSWETVTCADFEKVMVSTNGGIEYDLIALLLCSEVGNTVEFSYGPTPITWIAGQEDINKIVVTFEDNAVGTYTFTSEVVPVI